MARLSTHYLQDYRPPPRAALIGRNRQMEILMHRRTLLASLAAAPLIAGPARASSAFVQTRDGQQLFYRDIGTGKPVVFVHGWTLSSAIWRGQLDWLASKGLRAVAYDRRGHGQSTKPAGGYDYDTLSGDLASVLDHLDLRRVTLVAHSMGGGEVVRAHDSLRAQDRRQSRRHRKGGR